MAAPARAGDNVYRLELRGRVVEGTPLTFSENRVALLARDGRLWDFHPSEARELSALSGPFRAYAHGELRGELLREFGSRFDVSGTGSFLVVHPVGQRDLWAGRFEELYRSFLHYFTARGYRPNALAFPLVAVVFSRQEEFLRYSLAEGTELGPGVLGYYSPVTNRILMFDQTGGKPERDWRENAETIIHEAAHQSAFNTGIHSRYAMPPRWLAEGLGMLFEARGVWNSRQFSRQEDRINRGRLNAFSRRSDQRPPGQMGELISSDRLFQTSPDLAYAEAWALTFFLSETEPRKYFSYLAKTASRPAFSEYRSPDRVRDFVSVFGGDLPLLEARYLRYMAALK